MRFLILNLIFILGTQASWKSDQNKLSGTWEAFNYSCSEDSKDGLALKSFQKELASKKSFFKTIFKKDKKQFRFLKQGFARTKLYGGCVFTSGGHTREMADGKFRVVLDEVKCSDSCQKFCTDTLPIHDLIGKRLDYKYQFVGKFLKLSRQVIGVDKNGKRTHNCPPKSHEVILLKKGA